MNFEVNISVITSSWKIVPYSKFRGDTTALSGGEIVNLIHTESEGFLTCDGTDFTKDG